MEGFVDMAEAVKGKCAIYVLCLGKQVIYVGATVNVVSRVKDHKQRARWSKTFKFDTVWIRHCEDHELERLEADIIAQYKPTHNKTKPPILPTGIKVDLAALGITIKSS